MTDDEVDEFLKACKESSYGLMPTCEMGEVRFQYSFPNWEKMIQVMDALNKRVKQLECFC